MFRDRFGHRAFGVHHRVVLLVPLLLLALVVGGGRVAQAASTNAQIVEPSTNPQSWGYRPPTLTVNVGDTIVWSNTGLTNHTVTSDNGTSFDSGSLAPRSGTFRFTATTAGTFAYHCTFHPWMKGTLVVRAVAVPTATTAPVPTATTATTPTAAAKTAAPTATSGPPASGGADYGPPTPAPAPTSGSRPAALPKTGGVSPLGIAFALLGSGLAVAGGLFWRGKKS